MRSFLVTLILGVLPYLSLVANATEPAPETLTNDQLSVQRERLPFWNFLTDIPATAVLGVKNSFSYDALPGWGLVLGSTAVLYHYDQDLLNGVQDQGRRWGLGNSVLYKPVLTAGKLTLWSGPTDTAGWLYFMGDGTIPVVMSLAFVGTGYFQDNNHLYNTGIEMADGLLTGSIFDQVVKHVAGRQSPSAATVPRGAWNPFPNLKKYAGNTSAYDAMASGHIMTATVMFTVIEQEYPQYNSWLYPIEGAWLAVLGWGMMNVGVHWASDYPLGIAMGYVFGKSAVALHHPENQKKDKTAQWRFFPGMDPATGQPTVNGLYVF